jgi:hypothetical protein
MSHLKVVVYVPVGILRKRVEGFCGVFVIQLGHLKLIHCEFRKHISLTLNYVVLVRCDLLLQAFLFHKDLSPFLKLVVVCLVKCTHSNSLSEEQV